MRSAISTGIIGTSPLHPRRLQLYPSLGKHFQTSPVPVHFNGNKMMMKMKTTYSSHVLFCTKSSGGLSKQQDYSNTNTAVSLLPPTQETPKMILRRILVSIVSSAALLLYSSLFISHCFAKTYDNCSVCEVVALQLFKEIKKKEKEKKSNLIHPKQPYYDPKSDIIAIDDIITIAEDVCTLRKNVHWKWKIPIEEENLENTERLVCDLGCRKTICDEDPTKKETICKKVMKKFDKSVFAKFINEQWRSEGKFESLKTHLCENLTHACSTGLDEPKKELVDSGEAVGISPELIDSLPTSKYKENFFAKIFHAVQAWKKKERKKSERCAVCQMEYKRGVLQITLPCKHVYHSGCIKDWLRKNKVCPLCRKEVVVNESN